MLKTTNKFFCAELEKGVKVWAYINICVALFCGISSILLYIDFFQAFIASHEIFSAFLFWLAIIFFSTQLFGSLLMLVGISKVSCCFIDIGIDLPSFVLQISGS